jgi:cell pole-organizing protein PopZ
MLQAWLDQNLPGIVEEQVRSEVERIARQARR